MRKESTLEDIGFKGIGAFHPPNIGWIDAVLSDSTMDRIAESLEKAEKNNIDHAPKLMGHMQKEISILEECGWFLPDVLVYLIDAYERSFEDSRFGDIMSHNHGHNLTSMWANYQKKNEFNPMHTHGGAYSFVLFWNIPTTWEEQNEKYTARIPCASDFQFAYTDILGGQRQYNIRMNPDQRGRILFFPAKLVHGVYPFHTSDGTRITISGNIGLNSEHVISKATS